MKRIIGLYLIFVLFVTVASGQNVIDAQKKFLRKNGQSIKITDNTDFSDLKALDKAIKGKRIILIGEFTHGAKEINLIKNRIIAYLHQKRGFNVLLLESGIGELYPVNFLRDSLSDRQMLYAGLTGPWQTLEYLDLMNYLKANNRLQIGGFDVQRTGSRFSKVLESISNDLGINKELIANIEQRYTDLSAKLQDRKTQIDAATVQEKEKLESDYRTLLKNISDNQKRLLTEGWSPIKLKLIMRTFENRIEFLNYYLQFRTDNDFRKRFAARDRMMAENILWFANQIYPNEKIIISAHNFHVSKNNEKELVMGEILRERFNKNSYAIGIFGGKGEYADNFRKATAMTQPVEENDIQTIVDRTGNEATFLHISEKPEPGSNWLFENITVNDSFINLDSDKKLILQKSFDGLILIRNITPPKFAN